jgi:hypothetical protein
MNDADQGQQIDFTVDRKNLYREEAITDLKVASIRRLVPVLPDGTEDKSRTPLFMGHTQLMSPQGPVPIQSPLAANNLEEAMDVFPDAMKKALEEVVESIKKMQEEEMRQQGRDDSRIIVPGRQP